MTGPAGWFDDARFGLFVHWDHASQQGLELSWPLVGGIPVLPHLRPVSVEQYHSSAATFDPQAWDPKSLAVAARQAGMGYAVLTTKHHSGYCLWPTETSDWSIARSPYPGDIVGEFTDAMRAEGLRVGLYFSLSDWHHPDYPAFTEADKPYVLGASPPMPPAEHWRRFLDVMFAQVRELLTNYGRIDVLWFDGGWERPTEWRATELEALIRQLQPDILINDRLPGFGDFSTPEQFIPPTPPGGRWETCLTMNESWGYNPGDDHYKTGRALIHTLCEVAGRGGNLLLNVSPRGDGSLPPEQEERLAAIGRWMAGHRPAIVGTRPGLEPWQFYGPSTRAGSTVYLHLLYRPYDTVTVRGMPVRRVRAVRHVPSGQALTFSTRTGVIESFLPDPAGEVTVTVPAGLVDDDATVLALELADG
jgi:alpha-L-fucosidase